MTTRRRWVRWIPLGVAFVVFLIDQYVKNWVVATLPEGETVPVLGEFLQWHFVRNPGAAFSLASGSTWIFTILASAVVVVIIWQIRQLGSRSWAIFLGLLLGGTLGNLFDRLTRAPGFPEGHVIDFISTPWMWLGFPEGIYNIADIAIVSSMVIFVLVTLLGLPIDGSPRVRKGDAASDSAVEPEVDEPVADSDTPDHTTEQDPAGTDETPQTEEPR
ncbi:MULTISPECIES: signal peptidase II [unclassified Leucobacter]|uniref:signal peptidase II n=1 Tax=unclassified Leucobacter TaxID=2621730 RepID=UPI00165E2E5E|nr:signal peptidase II [Leucobacter sp. CX169]MBC9926915.1 signal peptidase II [Leucobacter sp. cx-169]